MFLILFLKLLGKIACDEIERINGNLKHCGKSKFLPFECPVPTSRLVS